MSRERDKGFDSYRTRKIFSITGVREGLRLRARRVLTENGVRAGWRAPGDRGIVLADHALDVHGENHRCHELQQLYGAPFDCLLPREFSNLAVACRGAGFSQIAASSCRLSRTMMQLGHAAGVAVVEVAARKAILPDADLKTVRQWLEDDNVALDPNDARFGRQSRTR